MKAGCNTWPYTYVQSKWSKWVTVKADDKSVDFLEKKLNYLSLQEACSGSHHQRDYARCPMLTHSSFYTLFLLTKPSLNLLSIQWEKCCSWRILFGHAPTSWLFWPTFRPPVRFSVPIVLQLFFFELSLFVADDFFGNPAPLNRGSSHSLDQLTPVQKLRSRISDWCERWLNMVLYLV